MNTKKHRTEIASASTGCVGLATVGAAVGSKVGIALLGTAIPATIPLLVIGGTVGGLAGSRLGRERDLKRQRKAEAAAQIVAQANLVERIEAQDGRIERMETLLKDIAKAVAPSTEQE